MILIISSDVHELATDDVMDWLYAWNCPILRINGEFITDEPYAIRIGKENYNHFFHFLLQNCLDVKVVWYRRWHKRQAIDSIKLNIDPDAFCNLNKHLNNEIGGITNFLFNQFKNALWIDHPKNVHLNKLTVLSLAAMEGLTIPETIVTSSKSELEQFFIKHGRLISKPITEVSVFNVRGESFGMDTKEIFPEFIQSMDCDVFFPSLIQELIEKEFDIRIFYLNGAFYSMAILSQKRAKSAIDFRNYDYTNPDRNIPYKLPQDIEDKLSKLVARLNLMHCSIDMIKSKNNQFVFLEVNPVGQFGMVSKPCNYHLEMHLAKFLKQKNYE